MASGKVHDWVTWATTPVVWVIARQSFNLSTDVCWTLIIGALAGGLLLSPDLDTRSRPFYRWGIFRFIWRPYQWIAKHRSGLSHGVLMASWFRLLYLSAVLTLLYCVTYLTLARWGHVAPHAPGQDVTAFAQQHLNSFFWLGIGVWIGSLLHIVVDFISSGWCLRRKR